jgi:peptidoglycan/xylan/chitin deacetylase (PgdA/CDA1 family)
MRKRLYAEGGVPVFLELEDLAAPRPPAGRIARRLAELTPPLHPADALERIAEEAWEGGDEGSFVRAINYHTMPPRRVGELTRQLEAAAAAYAPLDEAGLRARLAGEDGPPPVLPVFYEGWRSHYDHALDILERLNLVGWFVVPSAFIDVPPAQQLDFAALHDLLDAEDEHGDGRVAMTWDELREVVARGHVVTCHTATHAPAADVTDEGAARRELHDSRARLEEQLGREVRTLTWLLGSAYGEHPEADAQTLAAGYELVLSAAKIQRIA